ncbi:MAG: hypothetical protein Q7T61_01915 [Caulobacter sp.]|nr:hypothetical protein [Caulobacter sp.]
MDWQWVVLIVAGVVALIGVGSADARYDFTSLQRWLVDTVVFGLFMYLVMLKLSDSHRVGIIMAIWVSMLNGIKPFWKWLRWQMNLRKPL